MNDAWQSDRCTVTPLIPRPPGRTPGACNCPPSVLPDHVPPDLHRYRAGATPADGYLTKVADKDGDASPWPTRATRFASITEPNSPRRIGRALVESYPKISLSINVSNGTAISGKTRMLTMSRRNRRRTSIGIPSDGGGRSWRSSQAAAAVAPRRAYLSRVSAPRIEPPSPRKPILCPFTSAR